MSDPINPNFKPGVGRLTTDRFTFQGHVDGASFRHNSSQIDLHPNLVVGSTTVTNVQDAISALTTLVNGLPPQPDATTTNKGFVQLSGDIAGTATSVKVTAIQNRTISNLAPTNGQVLTWDNSITSWKPSTPVLFSAGTDLAGTNTNQQVVAIGAGVSTVSVKAGVLRWTSTITPSLEQAARASAGLGADFSIAAQSATNGGGGTLNISGGTSTGGNLKGGVRLNMNNDGTSRMIQLIEPIAGQRVLGLFNGVIDTTSTNMPAGTGDMVVFIKDSPTPPTSGIPSGGCIVYSSGGTLNVKQSGAGDTFSVGAISNPSIWGPTGQQVYSFRHYDSTTTTAVITALTYPLPDNSAVKVDVLIVGKQVGAADAASFNLSMGYLRNAAGAPVAIGTLTSADPRNTAGASTWTAPTITFSGNNLLVKTGAVAAGTVTINWETVVQLTITAA